MRFEWNEDKDAANQKKHDDIAFATAALLFDDPGVGLRKDRIVSGEQRWHARGGVRDAILLVREPVSAIRWNTPAAVHRGVRRIRGGGAGDRDPLRKRPS